MKSIEEIILIILICCNSCITNIKHAPVNLKNNDKMEKFDIERFNNNKVNGEYIYVLSDSSKVRQLEILDSSEYLEELTYPQKPFTRIRIYYMDSGQIKMKGEEFYHFPIGIWQYYDNIGSLTKEINWDSPYIFSIENLDEKMQKYGVYIMITQPMVNVTRSKQPDPHYIVSFPKSEDDFVNLKVLTIDGITGKITSETIKTRTK